MIDARAARNDPDEFRRRLARKGAAEAFDAWLAADERWRELVPRVDELRAKTKLKGKPTPEQLEEMRGVKEELQAAEQELAAAEAARDTALAAVPNPPPTTLRPTASRTMPTPKSCGGSASPAPASRRSSTEIGRFDMERAARLSGSRFGYLLGDTALVALALYRYALDTAVQHGHIAVLPPVLVREEAMYGTGFFPTERSNIYGIESDDLYLTGTSEVALAGLHMGEILEADELPLRYTAFSTNFRREAGAAGKDTRGMFRVHQFNKVELFVFTEPERGMPTSTSGSSRSRRRSSRGSVCRTASSTSPRATLGAPAVKKYDIEGWFPARAAIPRDRRRSSNTTDFQARRLGIRYRARQGPRAGQHAERDGDVDRTALAILENFGGDVPDVLRQYGAPERVTA